MNPQSFNGFFRFLPIGGLYATYHLLGEPCSSFMWVILSTYFLVSHSKKNHAAILNSDVCLPDFKVSIWHTLRSSLYGVCHQKWTSPRPEETLRLPLAHLKVHLIMGLCCSKRLVGCDSSECCCVKFGKNTLLRTKRIPTFWDFSVDDFPFPQVGYVFISLNFRVLPALKGTGPADDKVRRQGKVEVFMHLRSSFHVHSIRPSCW